TGARAPRSPSGTCTSRRTASTAPSATTSSSVWRPLRSSRPTCGGRSRARLSSGGGSSTAWQAPSRIPQQARFDSPAPRPLPCELKSRTREARMQRLNRTVALVAMLLLLPAALSAQEELPHTYRGTVHAVHAGSVELVTGVADALRLVHPRTEPTTHVAARGRPIAADDGRPGCGRVPAALPSSP